jgi:hypothetical protein
MLRVENVQVHVESGVHQLGVTPDWSRLEQIRVLPAIPAIPEITIWSLNIIPIDLEQNNVDTGT